jgi:hypothetical protein
MPAGVIAEAAVRGRFVVAGSISLGDMNSRLCKVEIGDPML